MPKALSEEAVAAWLDDTARSTYLGVGVARAVLALVEAKVREGLIEWMREGFAPDASVIVARVMWREAPRG